MTTPGMSRLWTGDEVPSVLVCTMMLALEELERTNLIALYELAQFARDPGHQMFGNTASVAAQFGLHDGSDLTSYAREIICAATADDGLSLRPPLAD